MFIGLLEHVDENLLKKLDRLSVTDENTRLKVECYKKFAEFFGDLSTTDFLNSELKLELVRRFTQKCENALKQSEKISDTSDGKVLFNESLSLAKDAYTKFIKIYSEGNNVQLESAVQYHIKLAEICDKIVKNCKTSEKLKLLKVAEAQWKIALVEVKKNSKCNNLKEKFLLMYLNSIQMIYTQIIEYSKNTNDSQKEFYLAKRNEVRAKILKNQFNFIVNQSGDRQLRPMPQKDVFASYYYKLGLL